MNSEKQKIVAIMKEGSPYAYLATCDGDQPIVRLVAPIVEDDMSIWVATFVTSGKVKQLQSNPKICLAFVEKPPQDRAATVFGEAQIVSEMLEKRRVWTLASFDLSQYYPDGPESKDFCLLKIVAYRVVWRDRGKGGTKVYRPI